MSFTVTVVGADAAKLEKGNVYVVCETKEYTKEDDDDPLTKSCTLQHAGSYDENMAFTRQTETNDASDISDAVSKLQRTVDTISRKLEQFELHSVSSERPKITLTTFEHTPNRSVSHTDNNL